MTPIGFDELTDCIADAATCTFGESITYRPQSGGSVDLTGIFNQIHETVDPDTERVVATNQPTLGLRVSDLTFTPEKYDIVIVRNKEYRVVDSQEDGEAMINLFLHKVNSNE